MRTPERYLRDTDAREVDFVVLRDKKPEFAVETKLGERQPGAALHYFRERTHIPLWYQVHAGEFDYGRAETGIRVLPLTRLVKDLERSRISLS